ncbi:MAG: S1/P1 nuclease [Rhizobiales bacterium]|nr:S1/P1 nuclease [Hyphomicrobiales bacterium]
MRRFLFALIFSVCTPGLCFAWGDWGHRTIAEVAVRNLSEKAQAGVQDLLGGQRQFVDAAIWADYVDVERPESIPWHTVEILPNGGGYNRARDCPNDDCVVEKIKQFAEVVGNRRAAKQTRIDALKYLIHFVGDLHQPLHAYAPFNHPQGAWVRIGDATNEIHLWWDWGWWHSVEAEFGSDPSKAAKKLAAQITAAERKEWESGTPEDWANESFQITREFATNHGFIGLRWDRFSEEMPVVLPASVFENEIKPVVLQRLKMAGVRLAWLLNQALK